jgi:hypothetical protein
VLCRATPFLRQGHPISLLPGDIHVKPHNRAIHDNAERAEWRDRGIARRIPARDRAYGDCVKPAQGQFRVANITRSWRVSWGNAGCGMRSQLSMVYVASELRGPLPPVSNAACEGCGQILVV